MTSCEPLSMSMNTCGAGPPGPTPPQHPVCKPATLTMCEDCLWAWPMFLWVVERFSRRMPSNVQKCAMLCTDCHLPSMFLVELAITDCPKMICRTTSKIEELDQSLGMQLALVISGLMTADVPG